VQAAQQLFAAEGIASFVVADSPGYVAPRVVACIVNLACEMAQQGIASPADLDAAVRLGLGYPCRPVRMGRPHRREAHPRILKACTHLRRPALPAFALAGAPRRLSLPLSAPDRALILPNPRFTSMTNQAFICDAVRTPFGRYGGELSSVRTDDLGAVPLRR
jgi:3-hydroxybutyryl-CoA dehydrogenase